MTDVTELEKPIFLLGTGRCGSTFQQVKISQVDDIWIWGEHDGILRDLLNWGDSACASERLQRLAFSHPATDPSSELDRDLHGDATRVAWLNGFRQGDIRTAQRNAIVSLFRRNLPLSKRRWGFKEIRYGVDGAVPERLLELFPSGKIVHTLRNPFSTIESSISPWHFPALEAAMAKNDVDATRKLYGNYAKRWVSSTNYLLDLEQRLPDRVKTSRLEEFEANFQSLLAFLEVSAKVALQDIEAKPINKSWISSGSGKGKKAVEWLARYREEALTNIQDVARRAGYF